MLQWFSHSEDSYQPLNTERVAIDLVLTTPFPDISSVPYECSMGIPMRGVLLAAGPGTSDRLDGRSPTYCTSVGLRPTG
ncbi:MAG TPA: hypothetical protein V6D20_06440 [Candidatus Obscuribacterales bacterium]